MPLSRESRMIPNVKTVPLSITAQLTFLRDVYISGKMNTTHRLPECADLKV
jgi:hypothetical protein